MEHLSQIEDRQRIPLEIKRRAYLMDHCFEGRAVFPAVEAMQLLAASTREAVPKIDTGWIQDACFDRFLAISPHRESIACFNELHFQSGGVIQSRLVTRTTSPKLGIARSREHVTISFQSHPVPTESFPPIEQLTAFEIPSFEISSQRVYAELVPFADSYHNLAGSLSICANGVIAELAAPVIEAPAVPLGSPFPLDAAFHAACVWCQCFLGFIGFPVGFKNRHITRPTVPGDTYFTRIIPVAMDSEQLICDLWIWDRSGNGFEQVTGLRMKDVSSGRKKPPEWVMNIQSLAENT